MLTSVHSFTRSPHAPRQQQQQQQRPDVGCGDSLSLRWLALTVLSALSFGTSRALLRGFPTVQRGIADATVDRNKDPTPWLCAMPGSELALVAFAVSVTDLWSHDTFKEPQKMN